MPTSKMVGKKQEVRMFLQEFKAKINANIGEIK